MAGDKPFDVRSSIRVKKPVQSLAYQRTAMYKKFLVSTNSK